MTRYKEKSDISFSFRSDAVYVQMREVSGVRRNSVTFPRAEAIVRARFCMLEGLTKTRR